MFTRVFDRFWRSLTVLALVCAVFSVMPSAQASPFGQGLFGADVPFGSLTSLAINLGGNVSIGLSPGGATLSGTGAHTITVTSTDVVGYGLYIYSAGSTSMTNGSDTIPASGNGTPAPLGTNTWGYNIDGSGNYRGITVVPVMLKTATGPYKSGDTTTVTYGAITDFSKSSGNYTSTVTYTAVALTD